jgi:hypothetical protein
MTALADMPGFELPAGHTSAQANANGHVVITKPSAMPRLGWLDAGGLLIAGACILLAALAVAMGITSFHAQYAYIYATKHQQLPSVLEALGLDCGAVIFSLLGISLARLGRRAVVERVLVVACALGSCGMNALSADLGSPRSVAVWALPPVLFALTSDRLVAVIRRAALGRLADDESQRSAWRLAGTAALYLLRLLVAPPSTAKGARQALLNATPLPASDSPQLQGAAPAGLAARPRPRRRGPTKTQRMLALASERHGSLAQVPLESVSRIAGELAAVVDLDAGSARRELRKAVLAAQVTP